MAANQKRAAGLLFALALLASSAGLFVSAQSAQEVGTWAPTGAIADGRTGAASVTLGDGTTVIAGGVTTGTPTNTVLRYDPATNSLVVAGQLLSARVGHSATALADGRVLVIGGQVDGAPSADIELFDPASGGSTLIGQLSAPRTRHAAARITDTIVLVVGGANADGVVLDTVERVNVSTGAVSAGPNRMLRARAGASATTLIDGRVLVAGGSNGSADLRSAELYIPWSNSFELTVNQLSVPRSGHTAVLLPNNGGVLIAGGNSSGTAQASVDLLVPVESPDPFAYGPNAFVATAAMAGSRAGAAAGPGRDGYSWVDGGGTAASETYRFATIKTDKDDYAPGERAVISGSGWLPNSEVRLVFQEDPAVHADYVLTVPSDAAGNIYWDEWAPEEHDLGVRFYLSASDSRSRAQITFTDNHAVSNFRFTTTGLPAGVSITITGQRRNPGNHNLASYSTTFSSPGPSPDTGAAANPLPNPPGGSSTISYAGFPASVTVAGITYNLVSTSPGTGFPAGANGSIITVTATYQPANTGPTVAFTAGSTTVNESNVTQHVYTYSIDDPNAGDTISSVTTGCGANGVKVTGSDTNDNDDGSFACTFPDGPASSTVTVQATDNGGAPSNTATRTVTIANVAPTVTVNGDATANEGDTKAYTYTVTDPGDDPSPTITESCGANGTRTDTATANHFECTFSDGPASSTVSVTANDGDASNNTGTGSVVVTIANVGPTVTFTAGPTTVNESGVAEHSFSYTISDPGDDTVTAVNTTCGANGTKVSGSDTNTNTSGSFRCRFPDGPATSTVTAQATDSDGATGANGERAVTVDNVAPTVAFTAGSTSVDESNITEHAYTYSITDPGDDTVGAVNTTCGANGTKVVGSDANTNTTGSFRCRFLDGPATSTVTAQATDSDGGTGANGERAVTVINVAPSVAFTVAPTPVDESTVAEYTYTYSINDPGDDTVSAVTTTCGTNGTKVSGSDTNTSTSGSFRCQFPDGPATSTVTAQATDSDGATGLKTERVITVNNVAPAVEFTAGPASVDESGVTEHTYTYAITDPGNDTITAVNTTCGANGTKVPGSDTNTNTNGSFRCKFPDGPATSTVTAQATDSDGATGGNGERVVTVNNVGPTLTFTVAPASVNESSVTEYTYGYSITDPGDDTIQSVMTSCGTSGVKVAGSDTNTNTSGSFRCRFDDGPANSTVTGQATDSDGTAGNTDSESVTILNVVPTATLANNGPVGEGSAVTVVFTGQADPSNADTTAGFRYSFSCVNNPAALATSWSAAGMSSSWACTFGDNGSYTVLARILDKDNGYTDYPTIVTVLNISPLLNSPTFTFNPFTGAAVGGINFSDAGWLDVVSSSFNWAGTSKTGTPASYGPVASPPLAGTFASSHTFPVGCVSGAISVSVTDDDGGVTSHVLAAAGTLDVYSVGFMAPLKDGARNVVKLGNVIPVKLSIRDCNGAPVTGKTLSIWVAAGIIDYEDVENGAELLTTTSVSSADTNGFMRFVDSHYMYNLATKNLTINFPYTIVIKEGNLVVATAVIEPKK